MSTDALHALWRLRSRRRAVAIRLTKTRGHKNAYSHSRIQHTLQRLSFTLFLGRSDNNIGSAQVILMILIQALQVIAMAQHPEQDGNISTRSARPRRILDLMSLGVRWWLFWLVHGSRWQARHDPVESIKQVWNSRNVCSRVRGWSSSRHQSTAARGRL